MTEAGVELARGAAALDVDVAAPERAVRGRHAPAELMDRAGRAVADEVLAPDLGAPASWCFGIERRQTGGGGPRAGRRPATP